MKIILAIMGLILTGCSQVKPIENTGGYIIPDSCATHKSWVCPDDPTCDDESLSFLCEDWSK